MGENHMHFDLPDQNNLDSGRRSETIQHALSSGKHPHQFRSRGDLLIGNEPNRNVTETSPRLQIPQMMRAMNHVQLPPLVGGEVAEEG